MLQSGDFAPLYSAFSKLLGRVRGDKWRLSCFLLDFLPGRKALKQDGKTGRPACESKMTKILQKYFAFNSMSYCVFRIFLQKSVLRGVDGF
ncbi:hypothetical protein, partial [Rivihabitans pingtungensis]|uniref:hypothetical protein n=1 Tax=Rivihabitans pingtungensis TaxID=1054498 RepID=UPI002FD93D24